MIELLTEKTAEIDRLRAENKKLISALIEIRKESIKLKELISKTALSRNCRDNGRMSR